MNEDALFCVGQKAFIANRENPRRKPRDESTGLNMPRDPAALQAGTIRYEAEDTTGISQWSFMSRKTYVLDDQSALKVIDGKVEVVGGGQYLEFN